ncbi:heme exporter protein CcmD [Mangrovicella endophytica]|uniref:heme exporter protein CcmD n=1 Tax=Mangrovicella endophytica TaxID=2066697 RepID=UPI000C9DC703|nr:heme exporter protein CcmD [Mangrovicella endophytica]
MQNEYAAFIIAAYGISLLALLALAGWIVFEGRQQRRQLAALEARGVRRRSAARAEARAPQEPVA